ncbi:hypothetical protein ACIPPQ_18835 [Sphingopyxis sp. LARHCG72]
MTGAATAPTPAHLFMMLWREVAALTPSARSVAVSPGSGFRGAALDIAGQADPVKAAEGLEVLIASGSTDTLGRQLAAMVAIDDLFGRIHPRTPRAPAADLLIPDWLRDLRDLRVGTGAYHVDASQALVARGPLLRTARHPHASSAETLADRFSYLSVVSLELQEKGRTVEVTLGHVGMDFIDGVEPVSSPGAERILFIPLAETAEDLDIHPVEIGGNRFAYYGPSEHLDGADRFMAALAANAGQDIAVAPELVMSDAHRQSISRGLVTMPGAPKLLLLGTQHSLEEENGQRFNEAVLVNSVGKELCRQRKLWPAAIGADKAKALGLCCPENPDSVLENNAAAKAIHVADMDGFGRVVVLICQDTQLSIAAQLIDDFQPDWVLVPVLDCNLAGGRWAHQRTLALSANSQSRFIAVTSTTLKWRYEQDTDPVIGMAIGPAMPAADDEMERAAIFVVADPGQSPAIGRALWGGAGWVQSRLLTN